MTHMRDLMVIAACSFFVLHLFFAGRRFRDNVTLPFGPSYAITSSEGVVYVLNRYTGQVFQLGDDREWVSVSKALP